MLESPGLTFAQSAEMLRLALPKMSKHSDGFYPISYAIWYEYVRGTNNDLMHGIDNLVARHGRLSADQTSNVFDAHVRARADQAVAQARTGLLALLQNVQKIVVDLGSDSEGFGTRLREFGDAITATDSIDVIQQQVDLMAKQVSGMRSSMSHLSTELTANQSEVARLTDELQRLRDDAMTDALSGLLNRRGFDRALAALESGANRDQPPFSLVMIDIDHFKRVNDNFGHLTGDRVIQGIAALLRACVKGNDTLARYGGEEFAVLLPATTMTGALTVAEQIRSTIQRARIRRMNSEEVVTQLTVSAGVGQFRRGEEVEQLVQRTDSALYLAKQSGRNKVCTEG